MKKILLGILLVATVVTVTKSVDAASPEYLKYDTEPQPCSVGTCPSNLVNLYNQSSPDNPYYGERCVDNLKDFQADPIKNHYWVTDPEVIAQAKADERARQFIYWVMNKNAIDDHPILKAFWVMTRNVAFFLVLVVAAILGLGFIIGRKTDFNIKIKVWPAVMKIALMLLYISFSATIVIILIQLSEVFMRFFIENTGGKDLFNIYFASISKEKNYIDVLGCRDLNYKVQEAVHAEMFLLKITNITYYVMGAMLLLRKILLWFLLFVSPFLAILFPFVFIRNIGWIWVGVFFQWLFYGPLFALFLGSMANIWHSGIPFAFDFSRVNTLAGYVYPTGITITYGGPAQTLGVMNNGNYVDTFVEYVITLIMQWAVIFFPWWLLRIFRDYCCDGIYAMKNILLSMYDQVRGGPGPQPSGPAPIFTATGTALKIPREINVPVRVRLETIEEIKKTKSEDITKSLNLHVSNLTDIARIETNKQSYETVKQRLDYLANPTKASTPRERQQYMNIRTELFNRAVKEDRVAKQILSTVSSSRIEQYQKREELTKTITAAGNAAQATAQQTKLPAATVNTISSSYINSVGANTSLVNQMATTTNLPSQQIQTILTSYKQNINQPSTTIIDSIVNATGIKKDQVVQVLDQVDKTTDKEETKEITKTIAQKENVKPEDVTKIIKTQIPLVTEPEKHVEQNVTIPPTVSIEDYEEVKKMWTRQYEKGEVPVTENITSRTQWVNNDIVFITNTLNKLLSSDEKLRQQGLDDLAYILPIFLINNLKGDELLVYLKAKLEAAKAVNQQLEREQELMDKLKQKTPEEELEYVEKTKNKTGAKTMTMNETVNPAEPAGDQEKKEPPSPPQPPSKTETTG